jgi:2-desacetyl-2-hydroxyethyl bacteriochlorophyllide A dehydrogenase
MISARIVRPNEIEYIDLPVPQPGDHELLVKVMASGICGTDVHIYRGEYIGNYPVIPGHEFTGSVEKVGQAVTRFKSGDRVAVEPNISCDNCANCLNNRQNFCLNWQAIGVTLPGGMAQYVVVPEKAAFDIGDIPFDHGAFMEPLSCVLHGIERLEVEMSDSVAVLGAGPIGLLLIQVIRLQGASWVSVVDKNPSRVDFARSLGADDVYMDLDGLKKDAYDVVIDATGAVPVMARTIEFVRYGGKVLLFGVPPAGELMSIEPFRIFRKGLTVLSSFTSVRNSYQALGLLKHQLVSVEELVSHRLSIQGLQKGIQAIERGEPGVMKVLILPNGIG